MNKTTKEIRMRTEYDFSAGVRAKHHLAYEQGTNVVLLDPDVAEVFRDSEAVNRALRLLINLAGNMIVKNTVHDPDS
jgi:hypothetical protein